MTNCFVIMSFAKKYDIMVEKAIIPAVEEVFGIGSCFRSDHHHYLGVVTDKIADGIINSDYIIAILTDNNVNMMYELGFAHAFNKPTIILVPESDKDNIPFDIRSQEVCLYYYNIDDKNNSISDQCSKIKSSLVNYLAAICSNSHYNNPIQKYFSDKCIFITDLRAWLLSYEAVLERLHNASEIWEITNEPHWYIYDEVFHKVLLESIANKSKKFYLMVPNDHSIKADITMLLRTIERSTNSEEYRKFFHCVFVDSLYFNLSPFPLTIYDPLSPKAFGILQEPMCSNVGEWGKNNPNISSPRDYTQLSQTEKMTENTFDIQISTKKLPLIKHFFQQMWNEEIAKEMKMHTDKDDIIEDLESWII